MSATKSKSIEPAEAHPDPTGRREHFESRMEELLTDRAKNSAAFFETGGSKDLATARAALDAELKLCVEAIGQAAAAEKREELAGLAAQAKNALSEAVQLAGRRRDLDVQRTEINTELNRLLRGTTGRRRDSDAASRAAGLAHRQDIEAQRARLNLEIGSLRADITEANSIVRRIEGDFKKLGAAQDDPATWQSAVELAMAASAAAARARIGGVR